MKKLISLIMVLIICIGLLPFGIMASDEVETVTYTDSRGNAVPIPGGDKSFAAQVVEFIPGSPMTTDPLDTDPAEILGVPDRRGHTNGKAITLGAGGIIVLEFERLITDGEGDDIYVFEVGDAIEATNVEVSYDLKTWYYVGVCRGATASVDISGADSVAPSEYKYKYVRLTDGYSEPDGRYPGADIDAVAGLNTRQAATGSIWANEELEKADMMNLIPDVLVDADLTKPITRAEFAAVAVKTYEALSGTKAIPAVVNPFIDCSDIEVLKAYNIGAVNGMSATTFVPDALLNREQAATMLTRVFKRVSIPGWTLAADSQFSLDYEKPSPFADDALISAWAKDSVYFMAANSIINGMGNNIFAPKNTTSEQEALGYANATRQQALLIAVRMVENLA